MTGCSAKSGASPKPNICIELAAQGSDLHEAQNIDIDSHDEPRCANPCSLIPHLLTPLWQDVKLASLCSYAC